LEVTNRAAGTNQEYVWRWDTKAGRYCAVGERPAPGKDGGTHYFSPTEYNAHNKGPNALVMDGPGRTAPTEGPDGETYGSGDDISCTSGKAGDDKVWGKPIYWTDHNTGHQVCVGVLVTGKDGKTSKYYFTDSDMQKYNNYVDSHTSVKTSDSTSQELYYY